MTWENRSTDVGTRKSSMEIVAFQRGDSVNTGLLALVAIPSIACCPRKDIGALTDRIVARSQTQK